MSNLSLVLFITLCNQLQRLPSKSKILKGKHLAEFSFHSSDPMSLPHALLTALVEQSCSGSELAARFDRSIGFFWHATHQQIYRELARLQSAGLIESLPKERTRGRRRAYQILPAGRDELKRWIMQEGLLPAPRDEFLVRLRAEAAVGPTGLDKEIHRHIVLHEEKLALYRNIEKRDFPEEPQYRETALQLVILHAGIRYERNCLDILKAALGALQRPTRKSTQDISAI